MTILPVSDSLLTVELPATYKRMIADNAATAAGHSCSIQCLGGFGHHDT